VTNMRYMFFNAVSFNQPLNWDTSKVTDMESMFRSANADPCIDPKKRTRKKRCG
jgi:hypothetical protein